MAMHICWRMVHLMRLQALKIARFFLSACILHLSSSFGDLEFGCMVEVW